MYWGLALRILRFRHKSRIRSRASYNLAPCIFGAGPPPQHCFLIVHRERVGYKMKIHFGLECGWKKTLSYDISCAASNFGFMIMTRRGKWCSEWFVYMVDGCKNILRNPLITPLYWTINKSDDSRNLIVIWFIHNSKEENIPGHSVVILKYRYCTLQGQSKRVFCDLSNRLKVIIIFFFIFQCFMFKF
jgi:hypothetical protein